ncbi:MAG: M1 family metallopeptidase, partial [Candidatus Thorarchaeota archaeon]
MKEKNHFSFCQSHHYQNFEGKSPFVPESAPRHYAPDLTVRCKFLDVNLRFTDLFSKKVDAKTTIDLEGFGSVTDTIIFHATADSIKIDEILINEKSINDYKIENDKLTIFHKIIPNNKYQVKISYIIDNPRSGLQWILPNNNRPQRPIQIWTQGESEETHYWIPCFDAPFQTYPTRLNVHVPKDFQVISNGKLMEHQVEQNEEIFIWYQEKPHPSYLISLCIGKFSSYLDTEIHPGVSLTYYADSSKYSSEDLHRSFKETPQMIQFLEKKLEVNFPWAKYTQTVLEDFRGAMENTSATSWFWSSLLSKDEYAITPNPHRTEEVNFHELAHQWFGDLVVIKNFDSAFLKEGMVTYLTSCYLEEFYGKDEHYIDMYINQEDYFDEFKNRYSRPISYNKYNYSFQVYDDHTYPGGAWRFHMIRRIIGDELWWKTLNYYLNGNKHSTVESMDFIRALESTTGKNFREFFDDWIFKANIPIIAITYSFNKINGNSNTSDKILKYNTVTLKFDQKQALLPNTTKKFAKNSLQLEKVDYDKLFDLKFQISWLDENNSWHHESIHLTKQFSTAISFSVDNEPKALYINSNLDILMDYELINVSNEMYRNLAQHGQDTLARLIAVKELIVKDFVKERDTIIAVIEKEASLNRKSFQKMLDKLAETKSPEALTILKAISDKNKDNLPIISLILPRIGKFRSPDAAKYILEYI